MNIATNAVINGIIICTALLSQMSSGNAQNSASNEVETGRKYLYCGGLTMRLLRVQGELESQPLKYQYQEKRTYELMLLMASAYLPSEGLKDDYLNQSNLLDEQIRKAD